MHLHLYFWFIDMEKFKKHWIVNAYELLLLLKDGTYRIGKSSNLYGFDLIDKGKALALINAT
jgi:hypothetical protein